MYKLPVKLFRFSKIQVGATAKTPHIKGTLGEIKVEFKEKTPYKLICLGNFYIIAERGVAGCPRWRGWRNLTTKINCE
jgi:hypothetical protein